LETVAALCLTTHDIENLVDKLSTFSVMTLCPVVASTGLTEDKVIRTEELAEWASADSVHGTGLEIDEDSARHKFVARGLIEVDAHALQLEIRGAIVAVPYQ